MKTFVFWVITRLDSAVREAAAAPVSPLPGNGKVVDSQGQGEEELSEERYSRRN